MSNAQGRKNKQESQETLIREGDKVRRVRPDGSDGGYIFSSGSGHSPHSDRYHEDNPIGFSKEHLDWFREEISKHSDESINDLIAKIDRGEPDEDSEYWNILMEEKNRRLDEKMNEVYRNVSSEALRHMIYRHDDGYAKKELARRELLNGDMSWRGDHAVDPQNDNIYGEMSLVRSGRKRNTMSIDPIISQMPDDQFHALVKVAGAKVPNDIWNSLVEERIRRLHNSISNPAEIPPAAYDKYRKVLSTPQGNQILSVIDKNAEWYRIPIAVARALAAHESQGFQPGIVNGESGAAGLFQILKSTAKLWGLKPENRFDINLNAQFALKNISKERDDFKHMGFTADQALNLAVVSHHAGMGAMKAAIKKAQEDYKEKNDGEEIPTKDITPEMVITAIATIDQKDAGAIAPEKLHGRTKGFWEKVQKEVKLFK